MLQVAALGIEARQVQHHVFRLGLDRLRRLELFLGLFGQVLHGVKLAQDHAVFNALRLQGDDLFKLGDRLVEDGV